MTTQKRLWLGFGVLTALLVLGSLAMMLGLRALDRSFDALATISEPMKAAVDRMEVGINGNGAAVLDYLQTGDTAQRVKAAQHAQEFADQWNRFNQLARDAQAKLQNQRVADLHTQFDALGRSLLAQKDRAAIDAGDVRKFSDARIELERLISEDVLRLQQARFQLAKDERDRIFRALQTGVLALLVAGTLIAVVTGLRIGRAVISAEQTLRITLASIGDAVIATDANGRVRFMNRIAEKLTGWSESDAAGQPLDTVFRIVNESSRESAPNPVDKVLASGQIVGLANHTVLIAKDGTEWPIDDSAAPILDAGDKLTGVVLIFRDIAERRRSERALLHSEVRKSAMLDTALDCIITVDRESKIIDFNPAAERTFGYARDDVIGHEMATLIIPAALRERHRQGLAHYLATGVSPVLGRRVELSALRADGSEFPVELSITPIDVEGGPLFTAYLRDITERKRAQDQLREVAAELSEADRRKNEFLAMLAHELRNPLAPLSNAMEVLRLVSGNKAPEAAALEMMNRQVAHMVRLIDDLLDVSRISKGKIELRRERIDLRPVIEHALEVARPLCESLEQRLTVELPKQPLIIDADAARLMQVLGNLLNNACKFGQRGGQVSLAVASEDGEVVIRVRDNGVGIAKHQLTRIFEMFMQVDASLERVQGGLGLGLTLVKTLVEMHGGTVHASSEGVGMGSEFIVRLPLLAEQAAPAFVPPPAQAAAAVPLVSYRILVVDDNRDAAESLALLLELRGHKAQTVHDGLAAVEAAAAMQPDVILLDIGMPRLNGYEAARRIRAQQPDRNIVLVALTGWGQDEDRRRSVEAGFDAHLVKPVDNEELAALLAKLAARQ